MNNCKNNMCGGCPSCLKMQGYDIEIEAVIEPSKDFIGKYDFADMMIEIYLNSKKGV